MKILKEVQNPSYFPFVIGPGWELQRRTSHVLRDKAPVDGAGSHHPEKGEGSAVVLGVLVRKRDPSPGLGHGDGRTR